MSGQHHDPSCVFCKIVRQELPAAVVMETDQALAFLDVNPVVPGHTLLIPRAHHVDLPSLPDDAAAELGMLLPRLCRAVRAATGAEGLNVIANIGRVAGQAVFHVHWHVIPRFHDDPVDWSWPHGEYVGDALGQMRSLIARELSGPHDDD